MLIKFAMLSLLIFSYCSNAMDDDPKGKRELAPSLLEEREVYSASQSNEVVKFNNNYEKEVCKELFKRLPVEVQKIIEVKVRRLNLFDEVHNEFVHLQANPLNLGNKILTVLELWQTPREERFLMINRLTPSVLRWSETFTKQEFYEISKNLPKNVKKGLSLRVIEDSCSNRCIQKGVPIFFGGLSFFAGVGFEAATLAGKTSVPVLAHTGALMFMLGGPFLVCLLKQMVEKDLEKNASYPDTISDEESSDDMHLTIQVESDSD